jgi:hypothetical protein
MSNLEPHDMTAHGGTANGESVAKLTQDLAEMTRQRDALMAGHDELEDVLDEAGLREGIGWATGVRQILGRAESAEATIAKARAFSARLHFGHSVVDPLANELDAILGSGEGSSRARESTNDDLLAELRRIRSLLERLPVAMR